MEFSKLLVILTVLASCFFSALAAPAVTQKQDEPVREKKFAPFFGSYGYSGAYSYGVHYPVTTYDAAPVAAVAAAPVTSVAAVASVAPVASASYARAFYSYPTATYTHAAYPATLYHAPLTTVSTIHHYY